MSSHRIWYIVLLLIMGLTWTVNAAVPVANFTKNATVGVLPAAIQFTDTSTNTPIQWNWSFGDGTWDNETQSPIKTYLTVGNFTVNLTVSNADGSDSVEDYVLVNNNLSVSFVKSRSIIIIPQSVTFNDTSIGYNIINWTWDFGDG